MDRGACRLQSKGSHSVWHNWSDLAHVCACARTHRPMPYTQTHTQYTQTYHTHTLYTQTPAPYTQRHTVHTDAHHIHIDTHHTQRHTERVNYQFNSKILAKRKWSDRTRADTVNLRAASPNPGTPGRICGGWETLMTVQGNREVWSGASLLTFPQYSSGKTCSNSQFAASI